MVKLMLFAVMIGLLVPCQAQTPAPSVSVGGYVVHPKRIPWHRGLTLEAALAAAGGIKPATYSSTEGDTLPGDIRISKSSSAAVAQKQEVARFRFKDFKSRAQMRNRQIEEGETIEVGVILW